MGELNLHTTIFANDLIMFANDEDDISYMMRKLFETSIIYEQI